jgi:hypothetical protein
MEEILKEFDERNATTKFPPLAAEEAALYSRDDLVQALTRLAEAVRDVAPLFEQQQRVTKEDVDETKTDDGIDAKWLLSVLERVSSDLGVDQMARLVVEASQLPNTPQQQEEALFSILGASEEAMTALLEIFPRMTDIRKCISLNDLDFDQHNHNPTVSYMDPAEAERQRLRQEAVDAAQVAAFAQAEVNALVISQQMSGPTGSTHTVARKSEIELRKNAQKAHKRAAQALQRAKEVGAILEEEELLTINSEAVTMGQGGLMGRTHDELLALQQSLLPEGSRKYYSEQGLPNGTVREFNEDSGYEKVTIPPPDMDPSKLHARLRVHDIMDHQCARAFAGTTSLNSMQSTVFDTAFHRRENMLVCAPTGEFLG